MDQVQAEREAERRNAEDPERARFRWIALPQRDAWVVIKAPRGSRIDPLKATTLAKPKPPEADDPRSGPLRGVSGYG